MSGRNDRIGSRIVLRDSGEVQRPRASGASTPIRVEDDITCMCIPLQQAGPMLMILMAAHQLREPKVPPDAPKEQPGSIAPDLSSTTRGGGRAFGIRGDVRIGELSLVHQRCQGTIPSVNTHLGLFILVGLGASVSILVIFRLLLTPIRWGRRG